MTSKVHLLLALARGEFDLKQYGLHTMEDTEAPGGDLPACRPSAGRASLRCSSRGRSCSRCCSGTSPRTSSPWAVSWPGRSPGPPGGRAAAAVAGGALSGIGSTVFLHDGCGEPRGSCIRPRVWRPPIQLLLLKLF